MPTISVHVDQDIFDQVTAIAEQQDRSKSWIVSDALEPYLEHRRWMNERTAKTLEDIQSGRVQTIPHEQAVAELMAQARELDAQRKKE